MSGIIIDRLEPAVIPCGAGRELDMKGKPNKKGLEALLELRADLDRRMGATAREIASSEKPKGEDFIEFRHQHAVLTANNQAAARELREVEAAITKIESLDGSYGECEHCGEAISPARLVAKPHARYCIECQEHAEAAGILEGTLAG